MASQTLTTLLSLLVYWTTLECLSAIKLRVEPNEVLVRKYAGDTLSLSCSIDSQEPKSHQEPKFSVSWVIPTNAVAKVHQDRSDNKVKVVVKDLEETDGGNYTCDVELDVDPPVKTTVSVVVFPRGQVSLCTSDSFFCKSGHCIPNRYKCDGRPDCPDTSDEYQEHCGVDTCKDKLSCEDGRCLLHAICCREKDMIPPNCTIKSTIQCCKQLVHPALLDQDRYYQEARPSLHQQWNAQPDSTLIMGCIVAIANLVTVGIIVGVRYHLWRSNVTNSRARFHLDRLRSATLRQFGLGSSLPPPSTTDQYELRTADSLYSRRIPGLRSDLLAPEIVREQRHNCNRQSRPYSGVVLCPPADSQPPHYSQLSNSPSGPPPSYHQVVGAPPPPYSSRDDLTLSSSNDGSSISLLSPLLNSNNNNGDINGNSTPHLAVLQNRNLTSSAASSSSNSSHYPGPPPPRPNK